MTIHTKKQVNKIKQVAINSSKKYLGQFPIGSEHDIYNPIKGKKEVVEILKHHPEEGKITYFNKSKNKHLKQLASILAYDIN